MHIAQSCYSLLVVKVQRYLKQQTCFFEPDFHGVGYFFCGSRRKVQDRQTNHLDRRLHSSTQRTLTKPCHGFVYCSVKNGNIALECQYCAEWEETEYGCISICCAGSHSGVRNSVQCWWWWPVLVRNWCWCAGAGPHPCSHFHSNPLGSGLLVNLTPGTQIDSCERAAVSLVNNRKHQTVSMCWIVQVMHQDLWLFCVVVNRWQTVVRVFIH